MTRQTSIDSYNTIVKNGLLSKVDELVYTTLFKQGPSTQNEIWQTEEASEYMQHTISPAFARLKRRGVIKDIGKRVCSISNRKVLVWDVTDQLPQDTPRAKPLKTQLIEANLRIEQLEEEVALLRVGKSE